MKGAQPVLEMELTPKRGAMPETALVSTDPSALEMFERLARDPNASVEKIAGLMALWERAEAKKAEAAFNAAMSAAQKQMRPIAADAHNPQTKSRYASYAALDRVLRPIYVEHGFGLTFNTGDSPHADHVRVLCDVTHIAGHTKPYHLDMPADGKGAKGGDVMTKTHATGSALTYGQRYLLKMIWNVAVGDDDDDGNQAGDIREQPSAPKGFDDFRKDLEARAEKGTQALYEAWNKAAPPLRQHVTRHARDWWAKLRERAGQVQA